jgi:hypothetical protein
MKDSTHPAVYVQTNEADGNRVLAFRREATARCPNLVPTPPAASATASRI